MIRRACDAQRGFTRSSLTVHPLDAYTHTAELQLPGPRTTKRPPRSQQQQQQPDSSLRALRQFFVAPTASQPRSWPERFRFLWHESSILGVSLGAGYAATHLASESLSHLLPELDALVRVFGSSGLWMPVSIVSYIALLRLLNSRGAAFAQPPPPVSRRGLRRLFQSTLAGKMGSESLIAWLVGAVAVATSLTVAVRLLMMPRMAPMDEASLDDQWTPTFVIGLLGPITEEVLFRALLFARCARFIGVAPAALFSGVAFGLMHGSDAASAAQKGMLYGIVYSLTGSLLVPIAMHVGWNSALEFGGHRLSPMVSHTPLRQQLRGRAVSSMLLTPLLAVLCLQAPLDFVAAAFDTKFGGLKQMGLSTEAHEGEMLSALQTWLFPKTAPAPQPADPAMSRSVFRALDYGDKGFLDASEVAWLMTLQESEVGHFQAVLNVIERRVRGDDEKLNVVQRNMERMPASVPLLEMPNAFTGAQQTTEVQPVSEPQQPQLDSQHRSTPMRLESPLDSRAHRLQSELLHRYYSVQWNAFYRAQFPDGCTPEAFDAFFSRSFSTAADRSRILAALRTSTDSVHPVAALLESHRSTKQGASR